MTDKFVRYEVPYKDKGTLAGLYWCLAWPKLNGEGSRVAKALMLEAFASKGGVVTPEVLPKYDHTIAFFDSCFETS